MLFSSLLIAVLPIRVQATLVQTTYSGYLVDYYCYSLCREGSTAIDGSNVITGPNEHTLHCLRDVTQCRDGFFLAERDAHGEYHIKFKLDDSSQSKALELVDSFEKGSGADDLPFLVTAVGLHNGDGYLKDASFTVCVGNSCDGDCQVVSGTCDTPADLEFRIKPGILLVLHVICMVLSWGCLLPLGVIWAHNLRKHSKKVYGMPVWFAGHRTLQIVGVTLQFIGFFCVFLWKKGAHFKLGHEIIGLLVVAIGTLQPFNALVRNSHCIGHPEPGSTFWERPLRRQVWECWHKGFGYVAALLGVVNLIYGPIHANNLRFEPWLVRMAVVLVCLSLITLSAVGIYTLPELRRVLGKAEFGHETAKKIGDGADDDADKNVMGKSARDS